MQLVVAVIVGTMVWIILEAYYLKMSAAVYTAMVKFPTEKVLVT